MPLQYLPDQTADTLGLRGTETFDILGIAGGDLKPKALLAVRATDAEGKQTIFEVMSRIDTPVEVLYYENGGILQTVLRDMAASDTH